MTALQFLTDKTHGCCTTSELMNLNKEDKDGFNRLKEWAEKEMVARGINPPVTVN